MILGELLIDFFNTELPKKLNVTLMYLSNIEHFFRVYIASSKHEEGWENSRQLCKPET